VNEKSKFMADDFHSFFMVKKIAGHNKNSFLLSFQNWDALLHPQIDILKCNVSKNICTVTFNEQNDFSKLIGFPGWKATEIITFNSRKLIEETIYIPDSTNPSYKKWLLPAVTWLQSNMPDSLQMVYQNDKLIQNSTSAKQWVGLLKIWRQNNHK